MKIKLYLFLFILYFSNFQVFADQTDCKQFKKFSAKYIECNANNLKKKTNEKLKIGKEKFDKSNIKDKLKKLKNSKTVVDLTKD